MPIYEYRCGACGHEFEKIHQRFSDDPVAVCPACAGGPVEKLLSSPAIQFKGSGWYITDYARKGQQGGTPASTSAGNAKADTKSDAAPSSEASTPAKPAADTASKPSKD